jgi:23S rRNA-/tRNA-specific pseudouridylate synthase
LSKNSDIKVAMIALFRKSAISKSYLALVDGCVKKSEGKIITCLKKKKEGFYEVCFTQSRYNEAITLWKCLKKAPQASLLQCNLITGRTHQLRVHFNWMGHPILGDTHYGAHFRCKLPLQRHLLHAHLLSFTHPRTNRYVEIRSELPVDFLSVEKALF